MVWTIELHTEAKKDLKSVDREQARRIKAYLLDRVAPSPRRHGKALKGTSAGLWRYRVGDYRIICDIRDGELVVLVVRIGHRREVYDR